MKTSTLPPQAPKWILVDAEGQNLGRLSTLIADALRGKNCVHYSPHQIYGDHVIVINASKLHFHPVKLRRKLYRKHTGYIGHLRTTTLKKMFAEKPNEVIERAVKGMLPRNRLRKEMIRRLHVYEGEAHEHEAQQPQSLANNS